MTLPQGRVLRAPPVAPAAEVRVPTSPATLLGRRVARVELEARERASAILRDAEEGAALLRQRAAEEGRALSVADLTAAHLRLREREAAADEAALARIVDLARLLAERLVHRALCTDPGIVVELAQDVLATARGASRVEVLAHVDDVDRLRAAIAGFDAEGRVHAVTADPTLTPGDLRLETDVGTIDARLGAGLTRLTERLREVLGP